MNLVRAAAPATSGSGVAFEPEVLRWCTRGSPGTPVTESTHARRHHAIASWSADARAQPLHAPAQRRRKRPPGARIAASATRAQRPAILVEGRPILDRDQPRDEPARAARARCSWPGAPAGPAARDPPPPTPPPGAPADPSPRPVTSSSPRGAAAATGSRARRSGASRARAARLPPAARAS